MTELLLAAALTGGCFHTPVQQRVVVQRVVEQPQIHVQRAFFSVDDILRSQYVNSVRQNSYIQPQSQLDAKAIATIVAEVLKQMGGTTAPPAPAATAVERNCAQCHSGADAKGGFNLAAADCKTYAKAAKLTATRQMPPETELSNEERNAVAMELLDLAINAGGM